MNFGKRQDIFGRFSLSKNDSKYLDVKLKVFQIDDNIDFHLTQNLTIGEAEFNQVIRIRNQLSGSAGNVRKEKSLCSGQTPTMSKYMYEQLKPAHNLADVVDLARGKICVTLLQYKVKPQSSNGQVQFFPGKKEDKKFQQNVYVIRKHDEFI